MDFSLRFEDNGTAHDDLVLIVGDFSWRCDSYYLALDEGVLAGQKDVPKVREVLRVLLGNWRTAVARLADGATAYLPYDFSDQCTAWLACQLDAGALLIMHGWASVEGWSLTPSDCPTQTKPPGFHVDAGPWRLSVVEFMEGIARSLEAAA